TAEPYSPFSCATLSFPSPISFPFPSLFPSSFPSCPPSPRSPSAKASQNICICQSNTLKSLHPLQLASLIISNPKFAHARILTSSTCPCGRPTEPCGQAIEPSSS
ncbi:hypothetical protein E4U55_007964, partial [Claviceps digitariae]